MLLHKSEIVDSRVKLAFAQVYLLFHDFEHAEELSRSVLFTIDKLEDAEKRNNVISRHENNAKMILDEIKRIKGSL